MNDITQLQDYQNQKGQFTHFPGKRQKKKVALMLEYLAKQFNTNTIYTEAEVNAILNQHHVFNDPAILRRLMFGKGLLNRTRDGKEYWLNS